MSTKIILLVLLVANSCNKVSKTVELWTVEDKQLSSILGRKISYPEIEGDETGDCLCIIKNINDQGIKFEKINCEVSCENKFKLNCPYRQIGMGYKDYEPHTDVKKINQFFYQQEGERTKHALIADKALSYLEHVRNICFLDHKISGEYEIDIKYH